MATAKRRAKKGAKKASTKRKPAAKKGAKKRASKRGGKVSGKVSLSKLAAAVNKIETRVDTLEHNDSANQKLWLGMINSARQRNGQKSISHLPGFAKPRLYSGGYGSRKAAHKALPSGF